MYGEVNCCEPVSDMKTCTPVTITKTMKDDLTEVMNIAYENMQQVIMMNNFLFCKGKEDDVNTNNIECMADQVATIKQEVMITQATLSEIIQKLGL